MFGACYASPAGASPENEHLPYNEVFRKRDRALMDACARTKPLLSREPRSHQAGDEIEAPAASKISTSYVERQNLTMRMGMRRCTRLTNAFSKKVENFSHTVSLHYMHYNFARPHTTLANPYPRTPAMAAGIADHIWTLREIAALLD